ncbi:glycosyltransferase family 2 protein [Phytopseudomonas punonensis]|nr:glycosyltransferase family 2 protein [Pseudomonas punonensis]
MSAEVLSGVIVSVVCIVYNHEKYIRDALDGFLRQDTSFAVEFIVADDCSSDGTMDVINEYRDKFNGRLKVVRNESNLGFMKNLINALDMASGKYIAICEGDDYWVDPEKLSVQVNKMDALSSVDLSFHSSYIKYEFGDKVDSLFCKRAHGDCVFGIEDIIDSAGSFMPTASMLIRGDAYRNLSPSIRALYESYTTAFFTQLIFSFENGALYIDRPMSVYRSMALGSWTESVVNNPNIYMYWSDKYLCAVRLYNALTGYRQKSAFERAISNKHFSILKHEGISKQYKKDYFSRHRSELTNWQVLFWWVVRFFPQWIFILRKGKRRLLKLKGGIRSLIGR